MYCMKCGSLLPDDSMFCSNCGERTANPLPVAQQIAQPPQQQSAPDTLQSAYDMTKAGTEQEQAAQQFAQIGQAQTAGAEVPTEPEQAVTEQPQPQEAPAQSAFIQPQNVPDAAQQYAQFEQPPVQFIQPVNAPKKKKSKKGLAIGLGCGGAALVGAGVLTYSLATSTIMRTVMGDTEYAKSVNSNYVIAEFSEYTGLAETAADASAKYAGTLGGSLSSLIYGSGASYSSYRDNDEAESVYDKYDYSSIAIAQSLYRFYSLLDAYGSEGMTITASADTELTEELASLFGKSELRPYIGDFADVVNTSDISFSFREVDGVLNVAAQGNRNGSYFAGTLIQLDEAGNLTMYFPGMTERAVKMKLPTKQELEGEVPNFGRFDPEKLKNLYSELKKAYYDCYEYAVITYEDGECDFGGTTEKCTVITVKFDAEGICRILEKFADVLDNDRALDELFPYLTMRTKSFSAGLAEDMRNNVKNYREHSDRFAGTYLTSVSYVNAQNVPLGVKYSIGDAQQEVFSLVSTDNGRVSRTTVDFNGRRLFELVNTKENSNTGSAELSIYLGSKPDSTITVCLDYSDMHSFNAFGKAMPGGKYTLYLKDTPYLRDSMNYTINEQIPAYELWLGMKLSYSSEPSGSGMKSIIGISHDKYGHITLNTEAQPGGNIPDVPSGLRYFDPIKDQAQNAELTYDVYSYLVEKIKADPALMKIDGDVEKMTGTGMIGGLTKLMKEIEDQRAFREKFSGYTSATPYYASMAANHIYNYATGININGDVCIKLYFDSDGKLTVLDAAGQDAADIRSNFMLVDTRGCYLDVISNIYAEVWYSDDYSRDFPVGVTAVKCDSPDNIPADLPDRYDFLARMYPWESENMIDGWAVGTSPALETGDRADVEELLARASSYKDIAKAIYDAYYDYIKSSGNSVAAGMKNAFDVYFTISEDGKVSLLDARQVYDDSPIDTSVLFTKEDITSGNSKFITAIENMKLKDVNGRAFKLTFFNDSVGMTGVVVFDRGVEMPPLSADFFLFYGANDAPWDNQIPGIYAGHAVGTYPDAGGSIEMYDRLYDNHSYLTTGGLSNELRLRLDDYNAQAKQIYNAYVIYEEESGNKPALKDPFRIIFTVDAEGIVSYEPGGAYTWQDQEPESITGWFTGEDISAQGNGLEKKLNGLELAGDKVRYAVFYYSGNGKLGGVALSDNLLTAESLPLNYFDENDYSSDRTNLWTDSIVGYSRYPSLDLDVVCGTYPYNYTTAGTWDMSELSGPSETEGTLSVALWSYSGVDDMLSYASDIADFDIKAGSTTKAEYLEYLTKALYGEGYGEFEVPDIFALEPSDLVYFIDYAMSDKELGITEEDTKDMFVFTKRYGLNKDNDMAAFAPFICPGGFIYRKDIARKVLGTDDPYEVSEMINGWDNFEAVAKKMKESGYYMVPNTDSMLYGFIQNAENDDFVDTDNKVFGSDIQEWFDLTKRMIDGGCTPQCESWLEDWMHEHTEEGTTFGDFFPLWGTTEWMFTGDEWAICAPPVEYSWGGLYLCVSKHCRNPELAAKVIKRLTCESSTQELIGRQFSLTMPNNIGVMESLCDDENYLAGLSANSPAFDWSGMKLLFSSAMTYEPNTPTWPESMLNECLTQSMRDYFLGKTTYDEAFEKLTSMLYSSR